MLQLQNVSVSYGERPVVTNVSIEFRQASRHGLLGATASGKSSLLRAITMSREYLVRRSHRAPLKYQGRIHLSADARIGYDPQEPSLAPWLNVKGNISLPFRLAGIRPRNAHIEHTNYIIAGLQLGEYLRHYPQQLSVGTSKRVSLARALVLQPQLLLLDEPFAGFDFDLREKAIDLLLRMLDNTTLTLILVSHDPYEVARLCDRAIILTGRLTPPRRLERRTHTEDVFRQSLYAELKSILARNDGESR